MIQREVLFKIRKPDVDQAGETRSRALRQSLNDPSIAGIVIKRKGAFL